jgi:hypothetical protein
MGIKRKKTAVSDIVGVALLLGMSIAMYSVVQFMVFSYPFSPATPSLNLVGSINENKLSTSNTGNKSISIGHFGGESISIDAKIIIRVNNTDEETFIAKNQITSNSKNPDFWNIGEIVLINESDFNIPPFKDGFLNDARVHVTVIDVKTNSVVMMGYIQGGSS